MIFYLPLWIEFDFRVLPHIRRFEYQMEYLRLRDEQRYLYGLYG